MRRRRRGIRAPSRDRWLVSYADFITLLFAFFVVMYSAAQLDKRRAGQLATAIQTAFLQHGSLPPIPSEAGGLPHAAPNDSQTLLQNQIERSLSAEIANGDIAVRTLDEGLIISLREVGFFDTGSDEIKTSSATALARLAELLRQANSNIRIEGHTDNVPIRNSRFLSNWDLSTARATATVHLLIQYGLDPARMSVSGYAEFRPVAGNDTAEGRAKNRRVDIIVPRQPAQS